MPQARLKAVTAEPARVPAKPLRIAKPQPPDFPGAVSVSPGELRWAPRMQTAVICSILFLLTAGAYAPVLTHQFIDYDDDVYVTNNQYVNGGLNWAAVKWAFLHDAAGNWHPLTWISHALDCQLYGLSHPGGHHATNLLMHALNVILLFLFLFRVTGATGRSFAVAALFALHPLNVESVAWIAERKNVLCTFCFLLALLAYSWYSQKPGVRRYLLIASLFAMGLMSKPMVVTLPAVLLLLDFWPLHRVQGWSRSSPESQFQQRPWSWLILEKIPLFALSAASSVVTVIAQKHGKAWVSIADSGLRWRLENASWGYATYLLKMVFPWHLAPYYPTMPLSAVQVLPDVILLLALTALILRFGARRRYLTVGYLWFLGMLVPVSEIVQVGSISMADRFAYIPLIGVFIAIVWGACSLARERHWDRRVLPALAVMVLIALAAVTVRQVSYWKDSVSIWSHARDVTVTNFVAEEDLGVGLANEGRNDEAYPHFIVALDIRPRDPIALLNVGLILDAHGRHQQAIVAFDRVIQNDDDPGRLSEAHRRAGVAYGEIGDRANARSHLLQALKLSPDDPVVMEDLAVIEAEAAVDKMSRLVAANPTALGYTQLGELLEEDLKFPEAQKAYENALRLDPKYNDAAHALAALKSKSSPK